MGINAHIRPALSLSSTVSTSWLEGRSVRVCGCAAAQCSGVLERRSVRVCGSEQWGERECLCLISVSSKNISKKRTPPSSCDV